MTEQVFLFGKVLEIDEALKNDIKLRVHMMEIGSQLRIKIQKMFSSINELYDFLGIREAAVEMVYTFLYRSGIDYLHNQGITNFNYEDIELISKWFSEKYEDLVVELVDYRVENEEVVVSRGLSGTRKEHELKKLERKSILKIQEEFMDMGFMDAMELIGMIEIVINNANIPITPITVEDEDKGVALFKELKKMEGTEAYEIAFQLFQIDPTEVEYYEYCMLEFPEETDNLLHLQQITGLALQKSILEKALKKMFEKMPHNTEEETLIIKNKLENIQKEVDISNNKIVKKVDQLLYDFDIQERTFCNILFDTREMKRAAEKDFDKLDTICGNLESMSEEECEKKKQLISEEETVIEIKQLFLEKIDNRIKRIWIEEDSEKIIDIFTHTNIYEKSSILQSIKAINDIGRTDDKKRYIDALNGINNDTLCIIRAYKEWENKKTLRKYGLLIVLLALGVCLIPFGVGIIVVLVGAICVAMKLIKVHKMKKTWNLLTLNGEVIHPQILVDDIKEENTVKEIVEVKSGEAEKEEFTQNNHVGEEHTVLVAGMNDKNSNKKKKPIYKRVWFWILIIIIGFMVCAAFGGSDTEKTEVKETEEKNTFAEMDFETLIGKSEKDIKKIGLETGDDYLGYGALDGDIQVSCSDGKIDLIMISGDADTTPAFHGIRLGMSDTEIQEKLSDKYTEELEGMNGKMYVNLDNCDAVNCQMEDGKVKTIMYTKLSEEDLSELYHSSMADEYIFPDSDVKYLSEDEVRSVEADKFALGRNEIFARHGYIFKDESFRQYFEGTSWYEGTVSSDQFNADSVFNDFEKKNVELIKKIEDEVNGTSSDEFIGLGGVYICTTPLWDGFTGKIELGQPQNGAMSFSLGVLEQSYNILSGTAVIIDSHTAQIKADGVSITLTWSNSENMYAVNEGSYSGKDADTIDVITDNMSYIRSTEFNQ